jgi:hypothetical protein
LCPIGCSDGPAKYEASYASRTEVVPAAFSAAAVSSARPVSSSVGSPPPTSTIRPGAVLTTVVVSRCPGPSAPSAATAVASLVTDAGVLAVPAPRPYTSRPVVTSITAPVCPGPSASSSSSRSRRARSVPDSAGSSADAPPAGASTGAASGGAGAACRRGAGCAAAYRAWSRAAAYERSAVRWPDSHGPAAATAPAATARPIAADPATTCHVLPSGTADQPLSRPPI